MYNLEEVELLGSLLTQDSSEEEGIIFNSLCLEECQLFLGLKYNLLETIIKGLTRSERRQTNIAYLSKIITSWQEHIFSKAFVDDHYTSLCKDTEVLLGNGAFKIMDALLPYVKSDRVANATVRDSLPLLLIYIENSEDVEDCIFRLFKSLIHEGVTLLAFELLECAKSFINEEGGFGLSLLEWIGGRKHEMKLISRHMWDHNGVDLLKFVIRRVSSELVHLILEEILLNGNMDNATTKLLYLCDFPRHGSDTTLTVRILEMIKKIGNANEIRESLPRLQTYSRVILGSLLMDFYSISRLNNEQSQKAALQFNLLSEFTVSSEMFVIAPLMIIRQPALLPLVTTDYTAVEVMDLLNSNTEDSLTILRHSIENLIIREMLLKSGVNALLFSLLKDQLQNNDIKGELIACIRRLARLDIEIKLFYRRQSRAIISLVQSVTTQSFSTRIEVARLIIVIFFDLSSIAVIESFYYYGLTIEIAVPKKLDPGIIWNAFDAMTNPSIYRVNLDQLRKAKTHSEFEGELFVLIRLCGNPKFAIYLVEEGICPLLRRIITIAPLSVQDESIFCLVIELVLLLPKNNQEVLDLVSPTLLIDQISNKNMKVASLAASLMSNWASNAELLQPIGVPKIIECLKYGRACIALPFLLPQTMAFDINSIELIKELIIVATTAANREEISKSLICLRNISYLASSKSTEWLCNGSMQWLTKLIKGEWGAALGIASNLIQYEALQPQDALAIFKSGSSSCEFKKEALLYLNNFFVHFNDSAKIFENIIPIFQDCLSARYHPVVREVGTLFLLNITIADRSLASSIILKNGLYNLLFSVPEVPSSRSIFGKFCTTQYQDIHYSPNRQIKSNTLQIVSNLLHLENLSVLTRTDILGFIDSIFDEGVDVDLQPFSRVISKLIEEPEIFPILLKHHQRVAETILNCIGENYGISLLTRILFFAELHLVNLDQIWNVIIHSVSFGFRVTRLLIDLVFTTNARKDLKDCLSLIFATFRSSKNIASEGTYGSNLVNIHSRLENAIFDWIEVNGYDNGILSYLDIIIQYTENCQHAKIECCTSKYLILLTGALLSSNSTTKIQALESLFNLVSNCEKNKTLVTSNQLLIASLSKLFTPESPLKLFTATSNVYKVLFTKNAFNKVSLATNDKKGSLNTLATIFFNCIRYRKIGYLLEILDLLIHYATTKVGQLEIIRVDGILDGIFDLFAFKNVDIVESSLALMRLLLIEKECKIKAMSNSRFFDSILMLLKNDTFSSDAPLISTIWVLLYNCETAKVGLKSAGIQNILISSKNSSPNYSSKLDPVLKLLS